MPLQNRLKEFRAAQGINQQELGTLVGASRQTISLIERGDYNPSITLALRRDHHHLRPHWRHRGRCRCVQ